MRYQNRIYVQSPISCVRNKDIVNVTTSSDLCEYNKPIFEMVGADKIKTGSTASDDEIHIVPETGTTIDLTFNFSGDAGNFITGDTIFQYNIYKYNQNATTFSAPEIFASGPIEWSSFSATSAFTDSILVSDLNIDGEYLIKGFFDFEVCTDILGRLGDRDTTFRLIGDEFGLYEPEFDFYFAAIRAATKPIFGLTPDSGTALGALFVESYIIEDSGTTQVTVSSLWTGKPIVALNGLTFAEGFENDYELSDNQTITFNSPLSVDDIVTVAYVNGGNPNGLVVENTIVPTLIVSGVTDGEGEEVVYFNTDTGKYELYLLTEPVDFNDVIVTLNGVTLANGLDYLQSTSNTKRIILQGDIFPDDILTVAYNSAGTFVGVINVDNFDLLWTVAPPPINNNGLFTALVADDNSFSAGTIIYSATTPYVTNVSTYQVNIDLSSYTGTTAFYKVSNQKNYPVLSGGTIQSITDSDIIPIELEL
jgi:hypothetical protein